MRRFDVVMERLVQRGARRRLAGVEFCEACGTVCDARCRADALREAHRDRAMATGFPR